MIALVALCLALVALLIVSRREVVRLETELLARDHTVARTVTALATERAARLQLERDPRTLHRRVVADLTR
jgi:hypothetical protein